MVILISVVSGASLRAQTASQADSQIGITAVSVDPAKPKAETLCTLRVDLENKGDQVASQLEFKVEINAANLPVYDNQVFMVPVPSGKTTEIKLYNFWSTETSRQWPEDGRLNIEVTLVAAQWMNISETDGIEVWEPLGPVEGLPVSQKASISLKK
jgi:hypothetical protein